MTCQKWTTKEQEIWLLERNAAFLKANATKSASKDFFPEVTKAFREKWPVDPVTSAEVKDAGTADYAARVKREKYDKRTTSWYHNPNRAATASGLGALLSVKPSQTKKLQPWQAYQALTYQTHWKDDVEKEWSDYKAAWVLEHPGEKPPKKRLEILSIFMRKKYEESSEEMKKMCEKYRSPETREEVAPSPTRTDEDVNKEYQSAIGKLPRTLANIGDALSRQTGWNITIIAGGPAPVNGGAILSYISNTGKTIDGRSYNEFLGARAYDESVIHPFERFLAQCYTAEDCSGRALTTGNGTATNSNNLEAGNNVEEQNQQAGDNIEGRDEHTNIDNPVGASSTVTPGPNATTTAPAVPIPTIQPSQYEVKRAQNIEELAQVLRKLKEDFPPPEGRTEKGKKEKAPRAKKQADENVGERSVEKRQSLRLKDIANTIDPATDSAAASAPREVQTVAVPSVLVAPSSPVDPSALPSASLLIPELSTGTSPPLSAGVSPTTSILLNAIDNNPLQVPSTDGDSSLPAAPDTQVVVNQDATMQVADESATSDATNTTEIPSWLQQMVARIRTYSEDARWQKLVEEFIAFEKNGPSVGNLPTKLRPKEVSDWIKSKKKDVIPNVKPADFGARFIMWWIQLQPVWRKGETPTLPMQRQVPGGETWQTLRKGGAAGIYTVFVALGWWVKHGSEGENPDVWVAVEDLSWVMGQINGNRGLSNSKRTHDDEIKDDRPTKSPRLS